MKSVIPVKSGLMVYAGAALMMLQLGFAGQALAAGCPEVTVADSKGVPAGKYPQQYELSEFESLANCKLSFRGNPDAAALNKRIRGNLPDNNETALSFLSGIGALVPIYNPEVVFELPIYEEHD